MKLEWDGGGWQMAEVGEVFVLGVRVQLIGSNGMVCVGCDGAVSWCLTVLCTVAAKQVACRERECGGES